MTSDVERGMTSIEWTVYGKVKQQVINGTTISFAYDANNNRISKTVVPSGGGGASTTWYVRDASGNVMSIYEKKDSLNGGDITQSEVNVYARCSTCSAGHVELQIQRHL